MKHIKVGHNSQSLKGRSSRSEVFCEKGVLKNFAKFTGLRSATLLKETLAQVFSYGFCEIFKNTFLYGTPLVAASGKGKAETNQSSLDDRRRCLYKFSQTDDFKSSWND